jgi:hypothetical protein
MDEDGNKISLIDLKLKQFSQFMDHVMSTVYLRNRSNSKVVRTLLEGIVGLLCLTKKATVSSSFFIYKKLNDTMFIFPIEVLLYNFYGINNHIA